MNDEAKWYPHKDIAWQAVLNCLPTRAFLKSRGCSRLSLCPTVNCGEEETTRHCLWECAYAQTVWVSIRLWLPNLYRVPSEGDIWCGELEKVHCKKWIRWRTIINVFKEALWKSKNFCVFQKYKRWPEIVSQCNRWVMEHTKCPSFQYGYKNWFIFGNMCKG